MPPSSAQSASSYSASPWRARIERGRALQVGHLSRVPRCTCSHDQLRHQMFVVAGRPLREVEDGQHQLQRVRRRAGAAAYLLVVDGEDGLASVPAHGVGVRLGHVDRHPRGGEVLGQPRVAERLDADAHLGRGRVRLHGVAEDLEHADLAALLLRRVVLEPAQPQRRHRAGDSVIRARISTRPVAISQPSKCCCSSRTCWPSRKRCWPRVLPTGPDQLPVWRPETRSGGVWSSAHHTGWSTGTLSRSPSSTR